MSLVDILLDRAIGFIPILLSLTVHEWAHAWTALRLGDDTAKMLGRVTLNPLDHIDPVGTLLLPLLGAPFGWAKPVPINPLRFRSEINMPLGVLLTAAAGPISNLLLAVVGCAALAGMATFADTAALSGRDLRIAGAISQLLQSLVLINVLLACFNLLPIPPLDGSRIVDAMMPDSLRDYWNQFSALGPVLLAIIVLMPMFLGFSLLAWPLHEVNALLNWVSKR
jgi:Zn-dependent protease